MKCALNALRIDEKAMQSSALMYGGKTMRDVSRPAVAAREWQIVPGPFILCCPFYLERKPCVCLSRRRLWRLADRLPGFPANDRSIPKDGAYALWKTSQEADRRLACCCSY